MKLWITLPFFPMATVLELSSEVERIGVEGVTIADHVCVPASVQSTYPYTGQQAVLPVGTEFPDPLTWIAYLGARLTSLRFLTHVLLMPLRHPVLLAKEASTVAALIGPRLDLGVGVGWMREEFDALEIPFAERGARLDEALPLLRELWSGEVVEHHGTHFDFAALALHPSPPNPIPLVVGGYGPPALRRAATVADGWVGINPSIEQLEALLAELHIRRRAAGSADRPFTVRSGVKGAVTEEKIVAAAKLGVDGLIVMPHQLVPREAPVYELPIDVVLERVPHLVEVAGNS